MVSIQKCVLPLRGATRRKHTHTTHTHTHTHTHTQHTYIHIHTIAPTTTQRSLKRKRKKTRRIHHTFRATGGETRQTIGPRIIGGIETNGRDSHQVRQSRVRAERGLRKREASGILTKRKMIMMERMKNKKIRKDRQEHNTTTEW